VCFFVSVVKAVDVTPLESHRAPEGGEDKARMELPCGARPGGARWPQDRESCRLTSSQTEERRAPHNKAQRALLWGATMGKNGFGDFCRNKSHSCARRHAHYYFSNRRGSDTNKQPATHKDVASVAVGATPGMEEVEPRREQWPRTPVATGAGTAIKKPITGAIPTAKSPALAVWALSAIMNVTILPRVDGHP